MIDDDTCMDEWMDFIRILSSYKIYINQFASSMTGVKHNPHYYCVLV